MNEYTEVREKPQKKLYLIWLNNWLTGHGGIDEFVFFSGGIAYVPGGFRVELIVYGIGFIIMLTNKQ